MRRCEGIEIGDDAVGGQRIFERFTVDYQNNLRPANWLTITTGAFYSEIDAGQEPPTNLSSKHRRNMRRLAARLGEELGAPLELDDRAGDEEAYGRFLDLEDAGWKGEQDTAMASAGH